MNYRMSTSLSVRKICITIVSMEPEIMRNLERNKQRSTLCHDWRRIKASNSERRCTREIW